MRWFAFWILWAIFLMLLGDSLQFLVKNWETTQYVVLSALGTWGTSLLLVGGGLYKLGRNQKTDSTENKIELKAQLESEYRGQINTLTQRLEHSKDDIERKNEKITELEKDINRLKANQRQGSTAKQNTNQQNQSVNLGRLLSKTRQQPNLKNLSNSELKEETIRVANEIQRITSKAEKTKSSTSAKISNIAKYNPLSGSRLSGMGFREYFDEQNSLSAQATAAEAGGLLEYNESLGLLPRELRKEILKRLPAKPHECLSEKAYQGIEKIKEAEELRKDLLKLIEGLPED